MVKRNIGFSDIDKITENFEVIEEIFRLSSVLLKEVRENT